MKGVGKGNTNNPNGRPAGSKNEKSKQWEELGDAIQERHAERFNNILDDSGDEQFLQAYAGILKYFKPTKLQSDISIDQGVNITFQNASKEFNFDKDGKSKKKMTKQEIENKYGLVDSGKSVNDTFVTGHTFWLTKYKDIYISDYDWNGHRNLIEIDLLCLFSNGLNKNNCTYLSQSLTKEELSIMIDDFYNDLQK